jgi:arsenate reductase
MAEGILKTLYGDYYEVHSAGSDPGNINPFAVEVMARRGVDISRYRSKSLKEFEDVEFDYVVTVCDIKDGVCPYFPGAKKYINKPFKDPSSVVGSEERKIKVFNQVMKEIEEWIRETFQIE